MSVRCLFPFGSRPTSPSPHISSPAFITSLTNHTIFYHDDDSWSTNERLHVYSLSTLSERSRATNMFHSVTSPGLGSSLDLQLLYPTRRCSSATRPRSCRKRVGALLPDTNCHCQLEPLCRSHSLLTPPSPLSFLVPLLADRYKTGYETSLVPERAHDNNVSLPCGAISGSCYAVGGDEQAGLLENEN